MSHRARAKPLDPSLPVMPAGVVPTGAKVGKLHVDEKLWQDPEGRMCVRGSKFAAALPRR